MTPDAWQGQVDEALRQALVNLEAEAGASWARWKSCSVLAGLAFSFMKRWAMALKAISIARRHPPFAGRLGERVAAPGVTVVDDGTLEGRRGSLTVDDEGTPTSRTVLIEDGIPQRLHAGPLECTPDGRRRHWQWSP